MFTGLVGDCRGFRCKGGGAALLEHMAGLGCPLEGVVLPWFSCLFVNTLPWATVLRIWDLVLLPSGGAAVLHRAALAILLRLESALRGCVALEQAFALCAEGPKGMHDAHEFAAGLCSSKKLTINL